MKAFEYFHMIDKFGQPISFTLNGNGRMPTLTGGIVTFILYICLVIYGLYLLINNVIFHNQVIFSQYDKRESKLINEYSFQRLPLGINYEDNKVTMKAQYCRNQWVTCQNLTFHKYINESDHFFNNYTIIDPFKMNYTNAKSHRIRLIFDIKNNQSKFVDSNVNVHFNKTAVIHDNHKKPFEQYINQSYVRNTAEDQHFWINYHVTYLEVNDYDDYFFSGKSKKRTNEHFDYDGFKWYNRKNDSGDPLITIDFELENEIVHVTKRTYQTFFDIISHIGGLISSISGFMSIVMNSFSNIKIDESIINLLLRQKKKLKSYKNVNDSNSNNDAINDGNIIEKEINVNGELKKKAFQLGFIDKLNFIFCCKYFNKKSKKVEIVKKFRSTIDGYFEINNLICFMHEIIGIKKIFTNEQNEKFNEAYYNNFMSDDLEKLFDDTFINNEVDVNFNSNNNNNSRTLNPLFDSNSDNSNNVEINNNLLLDQKQNE